MENKTKYKLIYSINNNFKGIKKSNDLLELKKFAQSILSDWKSGKFSPILPHSFNSKESITFGLHFTNQKRSRRVVMPKDKNAKPKVVSYKYFQKNVFVVDENNKT